MPKAPSGLRFVITGVGLSAFGLANFAVLHAIFSAIFHYLFIYVVAYTINLSVSYLVYSKIVFHEPSPSLRGLVRYATTTVGNFIGSGCALFLVVELTGLDPVLARVAIAMATAPFMFFLHRRFTFRRS